MRMVIAVDGSEHSKRARFLLERVCGGGAHQVTVFNATPPVARAADGQESVTALIKRSAQALVEDVARKLAVHRRLSVRVEVKESLDPASALLDLAEEEKARMIVLGARGLTAFKSFLLGSVSQKVSRVFDGSVMIARTWPFKKSLRVLVCVDGSYGARRALDMLPALGLPKDAQVTLVHAADGPLARWEHAADPGLVAGGYDALKASQRKYRLSLRRAGARLLADARKRLTGFRRRPATLLLEGHPVEQILKAAGATGADLIVVGRRGLNRAERFFMGSVSHKVSAYAPCSVLIVK